MAEAKKAELPSKSPSPPSTTTKNHDSGYDPLASKWTNYFNYLTSRMTPAGQDAFREDTYVRNEARDCARCDQWRDYLFAYSPVIRFLSANIRDVNGRLTADNVTCRRCPTRTLDDGVTRMRQGGGFSPDHGIMICANEMRNQGHLEDTLAHEMVHAWDHLRFQVDWSDLRHAACTEIRASSLSGECRWAREFFTRGNWTVTLQHQDCVRRRAIKSVMNRPSCKDEAHASKVVNEVWDSCFADTRPFDEIYR